VEAVFSATFAGVYAAFTEAVRDAVPESIVAILLLIVLLAIALVLDALLHYAMRTPNLVTGVSASLVVSVLSSAFNWYSMQRGALLVGPAARPFASDIASLPVAASKVPVAAVSLAEACPQDYLRTRGGGIGMPIKTVHLPREFLLPESKVQRILADERSDPPS